MRVSDFVFIGFTASAAARKELLVRYVAGTKRLGACLTIFRLHSSRNRTTAALNKAFSGRLGTALLSKICMFTRYLPFSLSSLADNLLTQECYIGLKESCPFVWHLEPFASLICTQTSFYLLKCPNYMLLLYKWYSNSEPTVTTPVAL
jgi:hypothetical protein